MRTTASMIELAGSLVILAWGLGVAVGRPWWWRWWARRPARAEGRAVVVVGVGSAVWSVGEGIALVPGTVVQVAGILVVLLGAGLLAVACARADRHREHAGGGDPERA